MTKTFTSRTALKLAPALVAVAVLSAPMSASAAISDGQAMTICKDKVRESLGEPTKTKLKRFKKRSNYSVHLSVFGVAEKPVTAKCEIDRDGKLVSFESDAPAK